MKKYILLIITLLQGILSFGQIPIKNTTVNSYNINNIIPVSPERNSLDKFKETEVSKFTGLPNIGIPLYQIKDSEMGFPISLNYHSAGIRVNEIASQVGLGWTIFSGGEITRVKKGRWTDDNHDGFIFTENKVSPSMDFSMYASSEIDTEPDEFSLNLPNGKSVKFYFSQDQEDNKQNIVAFPMSDIKITAIYSNTYRITSWLVKDTDGTVYEFGKDDNVEKITNVRVYTFDDMNLPALSLQPGEDNNYITSWKLTSIKRNNKEILFSYRREDYNFAKNCIYQGESTLLALITNDWGQSIQKSFIGTIGYNLILKQVTTPIETIKFNENETTRLDLSYSKYLKNIQVYDNLSTALKKQYDFEYDYFQSAPDHVYNGYGCGAAFDTIEISKRLYLKKVKELGVGSTQKIEHEFSYYDDVILPHRNSYAQDYWGYYNGEVGNSMLLPSYVITKDDAQFLIPNNSEKFAVKVNGSKRNINPRYTKACMLKSIRYPEGGYTEFVYENNRTSKNDLIKKELIDYYTMENLSVNSDVDTIQIMNSNYYKISRPFTLASNFADILGIDYTTSASNCNPDPNYPNIDCSRFNIINIGTGEKVFPYDKVLGYNGTASNIGNLPAYITPGNYLLEVYIERDMWDSYIGVKPTLTVDLEWGLYDDAEFSYFGGMRIKEIKNYTAQNVLATERDYSYKDEENKETGNYINLPVYKDRKICRFIKYMGGMCDSINYTLQMAETGVINITSAPVVPLVSISANNMAYTKVKETFVDYIDPNNSFSKNDVYSFSSPIADFQGAPVTGEWTRGRLLQSKDNVKEDNYQYQNGENDYVIKGYDLSPPPVFVRLTTTCRWYQPQWELHDTKSVDFQYYSLHTNTDMNPIQKYSKMDNVEQTTDYTYTGASLLSTETTTGSSGDVLESRYFYPTDLDMASEPYVTTAGGLIEQNKIGTPLLSQSYRNGIKLSEQKAVYKDWGGSMILPEFSQSSKGTNALDTDVIFTQYDTFGHPLEVKKQNGTVTTYIWGYNKTQPIAKIENATNAEVTTALGIAVATANESNLTAINNLRTGLPNAMVTTFTYIPLIGVSTITDPRGYTTTYEYDNFGRLKDVKDAQGNILSENEYHYRTQN